MGWTRAWFTGIMMGGFRDTITLDTYFYLASLEWRGTVWMTGRVLERLDSIDGRQECRTWLQSHEFLSIIEVVAFCVRQN